MNDRVTIETLNNMKKAGEKIASLTAYDAAYAKLEDEAGVDVMLVGDSLGMVLHGEETTLNVTMTNMIYHTSLVSNASKRAMVISDMPYKSYASVELGVENAERLINKGGAHMVKLEGGAEISEIISAIKEKGIPVCGHLGLTPQSIDTIGGYKVQATTEATANKLIQDALAIREAGIDCLVLECIPANVAKKVTQLLDVPTIGIGAGVDCDGQVLVVYDMLGLTGKDFKFLKNFLIGKDSIAAAIEDYVQSVKEKTFPTSAHSFE